MRKSETGYSPSSQPPGPRQRARNAARAPLLILLAGLPWLAPAHDGVIDEPIPTVSSKIPGPNDFPVAQTVGKQALAGESKTKVVATLVNQVYSNEAQQKYLLLDIKTPLPNPRIGLPDKATAATRSLRVSFFRDGAASAYAECSTEPRSLSSGKAIYSLGLKWNAAHTLMRWGRCDDPATPGADSLFPVPISGDTAVVTGPDGTVLARFSPPPARDVAKPAKSKRKPRPAIAKLMEGGGYQIKSSR